MMPGANSTYAGNGGRGLEVNAAAGVPVGAVFGADEAATKPVLLVVETDGVETEGNLTSGLSPILFELPPLLVEVFCVVRGVGATPRMPAATRGARSDSDEINEIPGRVPVNQASIADATSDRTASGSPVEESKSMPASMFIPEMPGEVRFADPTYAACVPSCLVK
jgi:hypothetical protein